MARVLMLLLILGVASASAGADRVEGKDPAANFRARLDSLARGDGFPPGAVAAFVLPDGGMGVASTGWADVEARVEMTAAYNPVGPRPDPFAGGYVEPVCWLPSVKTLCGGELRLNPASEWTGGGLATNPTDLARWAKLLYEDRALPRPYLDVLLSSPKPVSEGISYALGSFIYETPLGTAYGHGGWIPGYTASMLYFPAHEISIAIQLNGDCGVRSSRARDYALALAGAIKGFPLLCLEAVSGPERIQLCGREERPPVAIRESVRPFALEPWLRRP